MLARRQRQKEEKVSRVRGAGRSLVPGAPPCCLSTRTQGTPCAAEHQPPLVGTLGLLQLGCGATAPMSSPHANPQTQTIAPTHGRTAAHQPKARGNGAQAPHEHDQTNKNTTQHTEPPSEHIFNPSLPSTPTPRTSPHKPQKPPSQPFSRHNNTPIKKNPTERPKRTATSPSPRTLHPP